MRTRASLRRMFGFAGRNRGVGLAASRPRLAMDIKPDPKPVKRHMASRKEKDDLKAHFKHACCVATGLPYQHLHHLVLRSEGGDDFRENNVPLTNEAHAKFHSRAPGWERVAAAIRTYVYAQPERLAYALGKLGQDRFDRRYPPLNTQCARVVYRDFGNWLPCNRLSGHRGDCEAA